LLEIVRNLVAVKRKNIFPKLVAIVQTPIINKRYLTPRECARLQSFPENYKFIDNDFITLKQLGNSVNVDVVHIVCKNLLNKFI
jgi:DNA (cytosine-5)-methyltransferase 1